MGQTRLWIRWTASCRAQPVLPPATETHCRVLHGRSARPQSNQCCPAPCCSQPLLPHQTQQTLSAAAACVQQQPRSNSTPVSTLGRRSQTSGALLLGSWA